MNFQSLGDSNSVNKAIQIELSAHKDHLYKAWSSNRPYYREKYEGIKRIKSFISWLWFKIQESIWGNGESLSKLLITCFCLLFLMTLIDGLLFNDWSIREFLIVIKSMLSTFLGIENHDYPNLYLSIIAICKFIGFSLFMSVLIKKINRR
ncbi:hypothetical protein EZS27_016772 [termite gut metagenome]|uniref:Uncharacterized protein n=1 Tax=termite gut metagenome TaxID=433724 RepID=A0A5J4RN07_9ZZZZ